MPTKTVLHLRIDSPGFNSNAMMKGFAENGYEYAGCDWQAIRFSSGVEFLRKHILELADEVKPTLIFCHIQNPDAIDLETFKELQARAFTVNYSFDVRQKLKTLWMYEAAPHIGFTFFACLKDVLVCDNLGIKNTGYIHSSCDMDIFQSQKVARKAFDVVFCGNNYVGTNLDFPLANERQRMITVLEETYGDKFMCYGIGQKGGIIRPEVEASVYNHSKIAICQNNFERKGYCSDRIWRIMASGTMCLCKYWPGIEEVFEKEKNIDWFETFEEMKTLLEYYLGDDAERASIAEMGAQLVRENHSWGDRIREMEKIMANSKSSILLG